MTSFTLAGKLNGRMVEITWIDGVLSGDSEAVGLAELQTAASEGQSIVTPGGSGGPDAPMDSLSDPFVTYELVCTLLEEPEIVSGALPPIPESPQK